MRELKPLAVLTAFLAVFLFSVAGASAATAPGYEEWDGCPDKTVDPTIEACVTSVVDSGHLKLGTKNTPITDPITLTGGATSTGNFIVGKFDGGRQRVPGGLTGITGLDWLSWLFPFSLLTLDAESELAGQVGHPLEETFALPIKVRLISPLLSNTCYIGSNANPIALNLTKGTTSPPPPNQPISGSHGTNSFDNTLLALRISDLRLVDNAFAAPAANGCGLLLPNFSVINTLVNAQAGLPSPAGTNETIQNADAAVTSVNFVYPPAGIEQ